MPDYLVLAIEAQDRVGITLDLLAVLYRHHLNISSMEVDPGLAYIKLAPPPDRGELVRELAGIPGVKRVSEMEALPSEGRRRQMEAILESISEGVLATDEKGSITLINPAAEKIVQHPREKVLGRSVGEILAPDVPMLKTLATGMGYDNEEVMINTNPRSHYIMTTRPIKKENGPITGVVAALKDMSQVRELVYSITRPSMVTFDDIVAQSPIMRNLVDFAKQIARSQSTVLLRGESGTGKELFARAIHMASPRRARRFVPVNCAALPDTLLESELFGYEEGAFTGAQKGGKQGLFEFAHQGTLFLDEIGELSPHLQAKLLRVLQDGKVRRLGGKEELPVDVRVIAATSRPLEEMLQNGGFRADLYYRLNVIPLFLPPLREHREDIPALVENFIREINPRLGLSIHSVSPRAMNRLMSHQWPGNVRELANVVERGMNLVAAGEILDLPHLLITARDMSTFQPHQGPSGPTTRSLAEQVAETEARALRQALAVHKTSRSAGKALGVSHTTVLKKLRKYRLGNAEA